MKNLEILKIEQTTCNLHADRIYRALLEIEKMRPLTIDSLEEMQTHELAITELLTARFAKLQDTIGEKIFPLLFVSLGEDIKGMSFIDRLNRIEKLGYIDNAHSWFCYREARNRIAHEYHDSPALMLQNLSEVISLAEKLLSYWKYLDEKIANKFL